jgi:DNA-binding transcriptional MocR family regulator
MTPAVAPLRRRRLVDDAAETLRKAILDGRFLPGARLRQTDLADQLAISRTPIREALVRLQQEGLVELLSGGGVRVKLLDLDEAVELYDLREMLDGLAARPRRGPTVRPSPGWSSRWRGRSAAWSGPTRARGSPRMWPSTRRSSRRRRTGI